MRKTSIENIRSRGVLEEATTTAASALLCFSIVGDVGHNTPLDPFCLFTNTNSKRKMKEFRKHKNIEEKIKGALYIFISGRWK